MTFLKKSICMVVIISSTIASYIPEHQDPHLHAHLPPAPFDLNALPPGSIPSATFSGSGLIGDAHAVHGDIVGSGIDIGAPLEVGLLGGHAPLLPEPAPVLEGHVPLLPEQAPGLAGHGPVLGPQIPVTALGGQVPPGAKAPVIEEIQYLANSHGAPTHYNVREETFQVFRDVAHPVPHPVPVPVNEKIPVPVPQPYPVPVVKNVPVPVVKVQQIPIDKPYPVPVEKIVQVPVERIVQVPVEHPVPVEKIVEVPVVNIVKVPVQVVKTYPVPVVKTVHHYKKHSHHKGWW